MFRITLPDGSAREVAPGTTPADVAAAIGPGLAKAAIAARVDGELRDLSRPFAGDAALALFSFPGLAAYETYRARFGDDPEFVEADRIRDESGCVLRHDRTFMRPLLPS